jgi:tetratricopeptide (TPR) repeat protein
MKPVPAPWFQPKSKGQLFAVVAVLLATIAGAWVYGMAYLKKLSAATPPPVIQKSRNLLEERKYDEAVGLLLPVIQEIERTRGAEDTSLVKHCDLLASVYEAMKKYPEAEPMWRKSFDIRRKNLGPDHPESIGSGDKLGMCLVEEGKFAEAEALLKKSLGHRRSTTWPSSTWRRRSTRRRRPTRAAR